jgi:acetylornithine deacetylase/succinyl-diaminopimelate desuccinylase-like protein
MVLKLGIRCSVAILPVLAFVTVTAAQLPTTVPPPFSTAVPSGTGACSVAKSCAEVAPDIIRRALGASPLEENLRHLADSAGRRAIGSPVSERAIAWAVEAFRRAGADEVHREKFAVPEGSGANATGGESENVVAEIRGRELPDEFVVLAGHLDSGEKGPGAIQSGENAAMVIDAARAIHASGSIPRRSIRFVLFTGAEQGMPGARAYAAAHRAELDHMIAALTFDGGTGATASDAVGHVTGYSLSGRKEILAAVREALTPVRSLGADQFTTDARISPDSFDFLLEGIPTLVPNEEAANSVAGHPATPGSFDKPTIDALKHQVAIAAVTAYALSDTDGRVGSRQSRNEVEQLLKDAGLEEKMKTQGTWVEWEKGERGRQP